MISTESRPLFVVFEGADRVGKDAQADRLVARLGAEVVSVQKFATPDYSMDVGRIISQKLRGTRSVERTLSEAYELECLQATCRLEVNARAAVALSEGTWAVCSRWKQSAYVYGGLEGVDSRWFDAVYSGLLEPDVAVLLHVDPDEISSRRGTSLYDRGDDQREVSRRYLSLWVEHMRQEGPDCGWAIVPVGSRTVEDVSEVVWQYVVKQSVRGTRPVGKKVVKVLGARRSRCPSAIEDLCRGELLLTAARLCGAHPGATVQEFVALAEQAFVEVSAPRSEAERELSLGDGKV